jgi:hypothetical protein
VLTPRWWCSQVWSNRISGALSCDVSPATPLRGGVKDPWAVGWLKVGVSVCFPCRSNFLAASNFFFEEKLLVIFRVSECHHTNHSIHKSIRATHHPLVDLSHSEHMKPHDLVDLNGGDYMWMHLWSNRISLLFLITKTKVFSFFFVLFCVAPLCCFLFGTFSNPKYPNQCTCGPC